MSEQKTSVFIDGSAGTTGLRIRERLSAREDIELLTLPKELLKDSEARAKALNSCKIAFLCLPDDAAREAVGMITNPDTVVLDTSTAHRTGAGFAYGFPELSPQFEEQIASSHRISVPGCHASGFIALVYPLIENGLLSCDAELSCFSVTGYSGGGKKMIGEYESEYRNPLFSAPRQYGITQNHKHLREMTAITGLSAFPVFCPIVSDFYSGMEVTVPIHASLLKCSIDELKEVYAKKYTSPLVKYEESIDEGGFISAAGLCGKDSMKITVSGNEDRVLLTALYDNLGKGASGAAIECMNIALGKEKTLGLEI